MTTNSMRFLLLTILFSTLTVVIPSPARAAVGYCWCQDDPRNCIDNLGRVEEAQCGVTCTELSRHPAHFDVGEYIDWHIRGDHPLASCAPAEGGEAGYCWCLRAEPRCIDNHGQLTLAQCQRTCAELDRRPEYFDKGAYVDHHAAGLQACGPRQAVSSTPGATYKGGNIILDLSTATSSPLGTLSVPEFLGRVVNVLMGIIGSVALLMFVYGGFVWVTSHGSPEMITKGRNILTWAALGLVLIFGAYALVNFVLTRLVGVL